MQQPSRDNHAIPDDSKFKYDPDEQSFSSTEILDLSGEEFVKHGEDITIVEGVEDEEDIDSELCATADTTGARVDVIVKFDTACSSNMSGVPQRLIPDTIHVSDVEIKGFNNSTSSSNYTGVNEDGKKEYFVQSMPRNLALLCAHEYAKEGAAVLFPTDGVVVKMNQDDQSALKEFLKGFPAIKKLVVRNRTYEVNSDEGSAAEDEVCVAEEQAHSSTATKYFNSKVHVSNVNERVLATLLTGISFADLYSMVKNENVEGLPHELTDKVLNRFANDYGRTPDVVQLSTPNLAGNHKGYMATPEKLTHVGQRVEADYFDSEFNEYESVPSPDGSTIQRRTTTKLPTHGGAIAFFMAVDVYSGFPSGRLVKDKKNAVQQVKYVVDDYTRDQHTMDLFAADQGVISQSEFRVMTPAVQAFLNGHKPRGIKVECSEPYSHNYDTSHI